MNGTDSFSPTYEDARQRFRVVTPDVARMPRAELVVVPDSRHALPAERPEVFDRLVEEFLHRVEGDGIRG